MNYILLNQFRGQPYLSFITETCHTRSDKTYFYWARLEDEIKIPEIKALELLGNKHAHVLESVPKEEYWTINKLVQLLQSKEESSFVLYVDTDYERIWRMYTGKFLDNRDTPIYSIIRLDP